MVFLNEKVNGDKFKKLLSISTLIGILFSFTNINVFADDDMEEVALGITIIAGGITILAEAPQAAHNVAEGARRVTNTVREINHEAGEIVREHPIFLASPTITIAEALNRIVERKSNDNNQN